jgi:tRNA pseudouridine38-40 synthase
MYMPLDVEKMQAGAVYIKGEHDFKSFCSARSQVKDTVREVTDIQVFKEGEYVKIRVSGTGFLYNMVRIIAGTLIKVGLGVYPPEYVKEILDAKDRNAAGPKAPARGLTLIEIKYL